MKLNNRFLFGIVSLILAAVIAFAAIPAIVSQTNGITEIVRVSRPLLKGAKITAQDVEVAEVGGYNLPANIAKEKEDVVGKYAAADLSAGDYILSDKVSFTPITSDIQLNNIPSGKTAISMTVKTLASGLSDKLQKEDIIRIYHFVDEAIEVPELKYVKVLSVTDSKGINVDNTTAPEDEEDKRQSATITVLASPEQAKIIAGLENDGITHVALITRGNEQLARELLEKQEQALREKYPLEQTGEQVNSSDVETN